MDKTSNSSATAALETPQVRNWSGHAQREYPVVAAPHVRLRPFTVADISPLTAMVDAYRIADASLELPHPQGARQLRRWIESHGHQWQHGSALHWAICHLADDRLAGYLGLHDMDQANGQARITFWIGARLERRDLAIEAAEAALAFAFTSLDLHRIYALQLASNQLYGRVLFRIGMKVVAAQQQLSATGHLEDMLLWDLRHGDWLSMLTGGAAAAYTGAARNS